MTWLHVTNRVVSPAGSERLLVLSIPLAALGSVSFNDPLTDNVYHDPPTRKQEEPFET